MNVHIAADRISALVEETATADERRHLQLCDACSTRLHRAYMLLDALRDGAPLSAPPDLEARVARYVSRIAAGGADGRSRIAFYHPHVTPWLLRAAAAVILLLVGAIAGRVTTPRPAPQTAIGGSSAVPAADSVMISAAGDPMARLALLEAVSLTTSAALRSAPDDPGIRAVHVRVSEARSLLSTTVATPPGARWF